MAELSRLLTQVTWGSIVDVISVTLIIYGLLMLIQGTRADQILIGIAVLIGLFVLV